MGSLVKGWLNSIWRKDNLSIHTVKRKYLRDEEFVRRCDHRISSMNLLYVVNHALFRTAAARLVYSIWMYWKVARGSFFAFVFCSFILIIAN